MAAEGKIGVKEEAKKIGKRTLAFLLGAVLILIVAGGALILFLTTDSQIAVEAPPKATDKAPNPSDTTQISVPIEVDSQLLAQAVEKAIPKTLWTINQEQPRCIPPQKVRIFGKDIKVTPAIKCTIIGTVTRGPTRLRGDGQTIFVDVPIRAQISARDIGGILKGETATGSAMFHAKINVGVTSNWQTTGKVSLGYNWTKAPGIDFLGQRITFTDKADEKLAPVLAELQTSVEREFQKVNLRKDVDAIWRQAFTSLLVNERNPSVWIRVTPQKLAFGGYSIVGNRIRFDVGIQGVTETFVGDRPADPKPTALPALLQARYPSKLNFSLPVLADYEVLEPVLLRALKRRSQRPFVVPNVGNVQATFDAVKIYGTNNNRIAVGLTLSVQPDDKSIAPMKGMLWVTALPANDKNSAVVHFTNMDVTGDTDKVGGDLLLEFGRSRGVSDALAESLTQNFTKDLDKLKVKIKRAVSHRQEGDLLIETSVDGFETGVIRAYGNGLHLPVHVLGKAQITYRPTK